MRFLILSRQEVESEPLIERNCNVSHINISIRDWQTMPANLAYAMLRKDALFLEFDDILSNEEGLMMSKRHAKLIVDFVNKHKDSVSLIVVNCEAGVSRSSGVALALSRWLNNHDSGIQNNKRFCPNEHVVQLIEEELKNVKV